MTGLVRTPISASEFKISGDQTATMVRGTPLKYHNGSAPFYGIITGSTYASSYTNIYFHGAPMTVSANWIDADSAYYGTPEMSYVETFAVNGAYSDGADSNLLQNDTGTFYRWRQADAFCVKFDVIHKGDASTTNPGLNVLIDGGPVGTSKGGLIVSTSWNNTVVDIDTGVYLVRYNSTIELDTTACVGLQAKDLTLQATFVNQ